jgi:hypothetical protein
VGVGVGGWTVHCTHGGSSTTTPLAAASLDLADGSVTWVWALQRWCGGMDTVALNDNAVNDAAEMLRRQIKLARGEVEELDEVARKARQELAKATEVAREAWQELAKVASASEVAEAEAGKATERARLATLKAQQAERQLALAGGEEEELEEVAAEDAQIDLSELPGKLLLQVLRNAPSQGREAAPASACSVRDA